MSDKTTADDRAAWIILDAFRRHAGLGPYAYDDIKAEEISYMKDALEELRLTEVVRHVAN